MYNVWLIYGQHSIEHTLHTQDSTVVSESRGSIGCILQKQVRANVYKVHGLVNL